MCDACPSLGRLYSPSSDVLLGNAVSFIVWYGTVLVVRDRDEISSMKWEVGNGKCEEARDE
jgi:hypothetical protein